MANVEHPDEPATRRIRLFARGIAFAWAVAWTSLILALTFLWSESPAAEIAIAVIVCLILVFSALIGWRFEGIAAILLVSEGCGAVAIVAVCLAVKGAGHLVFIQIVLAICAMVLPPLVAGLLFHATWRRSGEYTATQMFKVGPQWDIIDLVSEAIRILISLGK